MSDQVGNQNVSFLMTWLILVIFLFAGDDALKIVAGLEMNVPPSRRVINPIFLLALISLVVLQALLGRL